MPLEYLKSIMIRSRIYNNFSKILRTMLGFLHYSVNTGNTEWAKKGIYLIHNDMQDNILMNWSSSRKGYEKTMKLLATFFPNKDWGEIPDSYKKWSLDQLIEEALAL